MCIRDRLASREGAQGPLADISEAEQVERLLDPAAHDVTGHTERLHAVGQLLLDSVGDEGGRRVLADDANDVREVARAVRARVTPVDGDPAAQRAPAEMWDQAVDAAQQGALAASGGPHDEHHLALVHPEVDPAQHGLAAIVEPDPNVLEPDHEVAPTSWSPPTGPMARSGGSGESQAGTSASSTPRAGTQGSIGHAAGDVCTTMPGTPRCAAIMTRTPAATPHPSTSHSGVAHGSGR